MSKRLSDVKRALQNTQNDCYQWLSNSSRVYILAGASPRIPLWELTAPPDHLAGLRGILLSGGEEKERKRNAYDAKSTSTMVSPGHIDVQVAF